jgi:DNA anti-recombination protein RmuC
LSPINQAVDWMLKACEITMNELSIIRKEVHDLRAANEKEKQKRRRSTAQISHKGGLTREEAQNLVQSQNQSSQSVTNNPPQS